MTSLYVLNREPVEIELKAKDMTQRQFIGIYIISLPTKGKNDDMFVRLIFQIIIADKSIRSTFFTYLLYTIITIIMMT